jgi:hypothetical protein
VITYAVLDCRPLDMVDLPTGLPGAPVHRVGPRPGKQIDPLLDGRILVVGDDADLAAVGVRLLRTDRFAGVEIGYAPRTATPVTRLWSLPVGGAATAAMTVAEATPVPFVRDDVGGVLMGLGTVSPVLGTVYVDEHRVLSGPASSVRVRPDPSRGLAVTVTGPRRLGVLPGRSVTTMGRAVQIGTHHAPATVVRDGLPYRRPMETWIFYKHTEPLLLVGAKVS